MDSFVKRISAADHPVKQLTEIGLLGQCTCRRSTEDKTSRQQDTRANLSRRLAAATGNSSILPDELMMIDTPFEAVGLTDPAPLIANIKLARIIGEITKCE